MNEEQLVESLNSIGKKSFVEDYDIYGNKELTVQKKIQVLTNRYSSNGAAIRVSFADKVFKNNKQLDALKLIINSPRMPQSLKAKAKELLLKNN